MWKLNKDSSTKDFKLWEQMFGSSYQINKPNQQKYREKQVLGITLGLMINYRTRYYSGSVLC